MSPSRDDRPSLNLRPALFALLTTLLLAAVAPALAQSAITWSSTGDTAFATGANWTGGIAPANSLTTNSATFDGTGSANPVLTTSQSLQGLSFTGGSYTFSATGGATLTLGAGGITTTGGNHTVSADLVLGADQSWSPGSGLQLTVSSIISGTGSALTNAGAGTLVLSGANTYTGTTTVSAGTLVISGAGNSNNSDLTVANSANLTFAASDSRSFTKAITGTAGNVTFNVAGDTSATGGGDATNFALSNSGAFTGTVVINTGLVAPTNNAALGDTANVIQLNAASGASAGLVATAALTLPGTRSIQLTTAGGNSIFRAYSGQTFQVDGVISGAGNLVKTDGGTLILAGANTYTGTTTVSSGTLQIGAGGTTGSVAGSIVNNAALKFNRTDTLNYSGVISGTGTVTQAGTGTLILSGANTYTGTTTVSAGTLQLSGGTLGGTSAALTVSGGTLDLNSTTQTKGTVTLSGGATIASTGSGGSLSGASFALQNGTVSAVLAGAGALTKTTTSTVTLSGANTFTGRTSISAGTLSINSLADLGTASALGAPTTTANGTIAIGGTTNAGTLTYTGPTASTNRVINLAGTTGGATLNSSGTGSLTFTSAFTAGGAGSKTLTLTGTATGNTIAGAIVNNSSTNKTSLNKTGTGSWVLSGTNTYTGTTNLQGGTLQFARVASLYNGTTASWTSSNITVVSNSGAILAFNTGGSGEFTAAHLDTLRANLSLNGVSLGFDTTNAGGSFTYDSNFTNGIYSSGIGLVKLGTGTLILGGTNTYSRPTLVTAGTLQIGGGGTAGSVAGASIVVSSSAALVFNRSDALSYDGVISGSGGVTQAGAGNLTLTGANTFTGATAISAGTLSVNGSLAAGSTVTVASGGTLGGSGTINGATTVSSGGTLAPGNSPGLLTFGGALTLNSGSNSIFEINGTARGTTFDAVNVSGLTTYGGTLTLSFGATLPSATTLNLLSLGGGSAGALNYVTATGSYAGNFTNNSGIWSLVSGDQSLTFTESTGNFAIVSAIPEPSTYAALVGAAVLGLAWLRRRKSAAAVTSTPR